MTDPKSGWPVVYYRAADGTQPVDAFIDTLEPKIQVVLDNQIDRIALFGPRLPFPHSSQVEGELRELHHAPPEAMLLSGLDRLRKSGKLAACQRRPV